MVRHVLALALVCSSCASMFASGPDILPVSSEPAGATVLLREVEAGKTPMQLSIPRDQEESAVIILRLQGFHEQRVEIAKVLNDATLMNPFPFNFIDMAAGNQMKVPTDQPLHVVLVPSSRPAPVAMHFPQPASRPAVAPGWKPAGD